MSSIGDRTTSALPMKYIAISKCYLLALPPELRLEINSHVFDNHDFQHVDNKYIRPPLLDTCKMLRAEALDDYRKVLRSIRLDARAREQESRSEDEAAWREHNRLRSWESGERRYRAAMTSMDARVDRMRLEHLVDREIYWLGRLEKAELKSK